MTDTKKETRDTNRVEISEMGLGSEAIEAILTNHGNKLEEDIDVVETEFVADILNPVAHIQVWFSKTLTQVPSRIQNYIIANELAMFDPQITDGGELTIRLTTATIYETWSGMDEPELTTK